ARGSLMEKRTGIPALLWIAKPHSRVGGSRAHRHVSQEAARCQPDSHPQQEAEDGITIEVRPNWKRRRGAGRAGGALRATIGNPRGAGATWRWEERSSGFA